MKNSTLTPRQADGGVEFREHADEELMRDGPDDELMPMQDDAVVRLGLMLAVESDFIAYIFTTTSILKNKAYFFKKLNYVKFD
jgi:hypothetical protein